MFTGIIQGTGRIKDIELGMQSGRVVIETALDVHDLKQGDSISVDGACLTITDLGRDFFAASVSGETLQVTTLGRASRGKEVNLEKALRPSDALGGHMVTGHVDGVGVIAKNTRIGNTTLLSIRLPEELQPYIVRKGSIAIDGISLTVNSLLADGIEVSIIPHTLEATTLSLKKEGDAVNVETDILAKYVEKILMSDTKKRKIDVGFLTDHGFINE
jgi:riboflavin synthase